MRIAVFSLALVLGACGPREEPPPLPEIEAARSFPPPWFICDALNMPALFVLERDGGTLRVTRYDKPNGALIERTEYQMGAVEGAAGSTYTQFTQNGADAGVIRQTNPGMLQSPGSAYTAPFTSVRLGETEAQCRWMPRTRLLGFTGRRTIAVHEDADGDLIYTTYDFVAAAHARTIELSDNARTTTFSLEIRNGEEAVSPEANVFSFNNEGHRYVVTANADGTGSLNVWGPGQSASDAPMQSEPLAGYQLGDAS